MAAPPVGSVVLVRFPFSDLSDTKLRPAIVLADAGRGDFVLSQVTSNSYADPAAIELRDEHFESGSLNRISYVRPGKLFTANEKLIVRSVGLLDLPIRKSIVDSIDRLLRKSLS